MHPFNATCQFANRKEDSKKMNSPLEGAAFLFLWIGFLLLMTGSIAAFFLWAIRAGQFSDQDQARYLPLTSGIPGPSPAASAERGQRQPYERALP